MEKLPAIKTEQITKKFKELVAVNSVDLRVEHGEIFGLLGPNGAGKTTLISMLVTMKKPTSGKATVNGFDVVGHGGEVRKSIGIVFQDPSLDEELTAFENLELHAAAYGVEKKQRQSRIVEVMTMVELYDRLNDQVKTFSGGMRRRLEIARALLHYPKILFLDEPTIGLDPQTRAHVWEYIKKLKREHGITLLLTTHYMDEADTICDRIAIIDKGEIRALGTSQQLKDTLGGDRITIGLKSEQDAKKLLQKADGWAKETYQEKDKVIFVVEKGENKLPELVKLCSSVDVVSINLKKPTLDDVFLHYTGRSIREEEVNSKESFKLHRRAWTRR